MSTELFPSRIEDLRPAAFATPAVLGIFRHLMKILLIGNGGREHALAWKLAASARTTALFCAPGNPGIAEVADLVDLDVMNFRGIEKFAKQNEIGLVVVGPEDPLAGGLVDRLTAAGIKTFGPTKE